MKTFLKNFIADESGASAAEYALILAIVGAAIAVAVVALGSAIEQSINHLRGKKVELLPDFPKENQEVTIEAN